MKNKDYWIEEWRDMMCGKMITTDEWFSDTKLRCETPDGIVTCDECRYNGDMDDV